MAPHMVGEWHSMWKGVGHAMDMYKGHVILTKSARASSHLGLGRRVGAHMNFWT